MGAIFRNTWSPTLFLLETKKKKKKFKKFKLKSNKPKTIWLGGWSSVFVMSTLVGGEQNTSVETFPSKRVLKS